MFKITTALKRIADMEGSTRIIQGGQGAGKTIAILIILINHALLNKNKEITIIQAELSKLKKTAMRDFIKIMKSFGLFEQKRFNISESIYKFSTGSYIEFLGLDKADVGKGFRRDVLYFNEINKGGITLDAYIQFASRAGTTYADYNPDRRFWLHEDVITDDNMISLTFNDNEYIPEGEKQVILSYRDKGFFDIHAEDLFAESNIKNAYWANKWKVYGLGITGTLDGLVFTNWKLIDNLPPEAKYLGTGLDFGYTNDPTAVVDIYEYNGLRVLDEVVYRTGMVNSDIAKKLTGKGVVYADSAEPKSIEEIRRAGIDIRGASKGRDSIMYGITTMQELEYLVTKRSFNLIKELNSYTWDKDKDGNTINKPIDNYNHILDAIRYHEMETVGLKSQIFTF